MERFEIETMVLGEMATNCYLFLNKETRALVIVDPAAEPQRIADRIASLRAVPEAVLLTHGHFDHIGAVDALRGQYGVPVFALEQERRILEGIEGNLSGMTGRAFTVKADRFLTDGQTVELAGASVQILHTPGHTVGSACYYVESERVLFSGDTLFCCSVGRTDFPTGSMSQMYDSLHNRLFLLPDDTLVLPGHDEATSIGYEKQYNPY